MPKSLAELRAQKPKAVPERSLPLCLAPHLVAEVQALTDELEALPEVPVDDEGRRVGPPPRIGVRPENPRAVEIRERLADLLAEMAEHDGELRVRAIDDGEWRRWVNAHPARQEGEPGFERDQAVAGGYCNADDLIDSLGIYACAWNGEPMLAGDWDVIAANIGGADKKQIATAVVTMHESRLDFLQWRNGLSASLLRSNASRSLEVLGSPPEDSSAGNPSSDTSTMTPTGT